MRLRHRIELLQKLCERLMDSDEHGMASVVGLSLDELRAEADRNASDALPPQESETVTEMRTYACEELCEAVKDETVLRWADELESANKRIAELMEENIGLRKEVAKGSGPLVRRITYLEGAISDMGKSRQPAPSREVDWEAMGRIGYVAFNAADTAQGREHWWALAAKAVVAAYEGQKGAASGD